MIPTKPIDVIWTQEQWNAIYDSGCNILVSAGAGSGKTAVLTERLTQKVLNGTSLSELIVLTFTKDAASTMKERLRKSLKNKYAETKNPFVKEQLQLIDVSHIQTFDSFTSDLVKSNNYLLNIPSDFKVFDEKYHNIVKIELTKKVIDNLFEENNEHIIRLANTYTLKNSDVIKEAILKILKKIDLIIDYNYTYIDKFFTEEHYEFILDQYSKVIYSKINQIFKILKRCENYTDSAILEHVSKVSESLIELKEPYKLDFSRIFEIMSASSPRTKSVNDLFEKDLYKKDKEKIADIKKEIKNLTIKSKEEFINDYKRTKPLVDSFIYVVNKVINELNVYKNKHHMYTFNDISKLAVKVLKENQSILNELKYNTKEILVDEYQDTSDVQEALITMLSNNNLYLVGDIKQSIYRFRNANPILFANKLDEYSQGKGGKVIDLTSNFRSREEVLTNINNIFTPLMEKDFGGVDYVGNQLLTFGNHAYNMYDKPNQYNMECLTYDLEMYNGFTKNEIEIFTIGLDILDKMNKYQIFDKDKKVYRKPTFKDFSIILMSKKTFKQYETIFKYLGIPLVTTESSSFIRSEEVVLIKSILECAYIKCNPTYEKIKYNKSLLSILRSFVYNTSDDIIHKNYQYSEINLREFNKELDRLLIKYSQMIETTSVSSLISHIYKDLNIYHELINLGSVFERQKKLEYLYTKSFEFDHLGILEFISYLDYIYKDEDLDIEYSAPVDGVDGVTLTTIHKSKGLEYPICYFANLDKKFNMQDINGSYLYSNDYGLIIPYEDDGLNSTFLKKVFRQKYLEEEISEKIRLFYVALTRAKELMVFVASDFDKEILKENIENIQHMLTFAKDYINQFTKKVNIYNNPLFKKDYYKINKRSLSKNELEKEYNKLIQEVNVINHQRASKQILTLNDQKTNNALELGTKFHNVLENISIKNANLGYYDSYLEYNIVRNFLNSDLIKNLDIINEYHEYAYFDEAGNKSIIDLVLETKDYLYLIDYKLSNTDDENYVNQLNQYKSYLKTITNKEIKVYLYSLFKSEFKELI